MLLGAATVLVVAWRLGAFQLFADPAHIKITLLELGVMGYAAFILAFGLVQPFGVPGTVFILGAALVWPPPLAIALSLVGATLSTLTGFSFSRYLARDWVEKRIPARLRKYDQRLADDAFLTVLLLRLVLWMNPTLHAVLGLSRVRFSTHLVASILGYVPAIVVLTYFGDAAFSVLKNQPRERFVAAAAVAVIVAVALLARRYARRRKDVTTTEIELGGGD